MKILVDAYNLYEKNGTGIARYTKELCKILNFLKFEVFLQFGLHDIKKDHLAKEILFQKLSIETDILKNNNRKTIEKKIKNIIKLFNNITFFEKNIYIDINKNDKFIFDERLRYVDGVFNDSGLHVKSSIKFYLFKNFLQIKNTNKKIDIYHKPYPFPCFLKKTKNITTIHDIIPLKIPYATSSNLNKYYDLLSESIKKSDKIITISEASKNDIIEYFKIKDEDKISVIYQSSQIDDLYTNKSVEEIQRYISKYGLIYKKYIVFYGAIEPKKNVARIISATLQSKCEYPLIIIGKDGWLYNDVSNLLQNLKNDHRIIRAPFLPDEYLYMIISGAAACIFPSLYEGFGLPILESMQLGCAVITSNVSSLPEIGGDAVHYVDPYSISSISEGIDKVCENDNYRIMLEERGRVRAKLFSFNNYANKLKSIYENVVGE